MKKLFKVPAFFLAAIFFIVGLWTLPHYGINWDTINHLPRGQVYLHYFLTGKKDYSDLPPFFSEWQAAGQWYWQKEDTLLFQPDVPKESIPRLSLYQSAGVDFNYYMQKDGGHPPLSDILSSFFNYILFQKLGIINDIDSYRVYGILLAAGLVGLIYYWVSRVYGKAEGIIASISLSLYPLFWSESHFNTEKDIPETVYWSFFLFALWRGVKGKSWKWILTSGVLFGLALGTKFNILFSALIIIPWVLISAPKIIKEKWFIASSFLAVIIGLLIFLGFWPYLWADPIGRVQKVIGYYEGIGLSESFDSGFIGLLGINKYPIFGILYTTPLVVLGLVPFALIQILSRLNKDKKDFLFLVILWFIVPVSRVVWPGTAIYGGLRQIMEYIPALAILAGIGGGVIYRFIKNKLSAPLAIFLIALPFTMLILNLIKIHPNENVYFNPLIGGLSGAKAKDFPFWGNTFGAAYRQGVSWLNKNAERGAKVAYAYELIPNIPRIWLRTDLDLHNSNRSGYLRRREYIITLPYSGTENRSYFDMYLHKFLNPVYEAKVDGVSVLTIWKNDEVHLKAKLDEKIKNGVTFKEDETGILFDLGEKASLSRLEINYNEKNCKPLTSAYVELSSDLSQWERLPGNLPEAWRIAALGKQPSDGHFIEPFIGQEERYIKINMSPLDTCLKKIENFRLYYFSNNK